MFVQAVVTYLWRGAPAQLVTPLAARDVSLQHSQRLVEGAAAALERGLELALLGQHACGRIADDTCARDSLFSTRLLGAMHQKPDQMSSH